MEIESLDFALDNSMVAGEQKENFAVDREKTLTDLVVGLDKQ